MLSNDTLATIRAALDDAEKQIKLSNPHTFISDWRLQKLAEIDKARIELEAQRGEWERVKLPDTERMHLCMGEIIMKIDETGEHGPYAFCRRRVDAPG